MPRFVLLRHDHPFEHYDLMLEPEGDPPPDGDEARDLVTYRLPPRLPTGGQTVPATPLPPHRRAYLWYEGPTRSGGGSVTRLAEGVYEVAGPGKTAADDAANAPLVLDLRGREIRGGEIRGGEIAGGRDGVTEIAFRLTVDPRAPRHRPTPMRFESLPCSRPRPARGR
ncbi:MAG: hypothetical protein AAF532_13775 [Planctomycetota bacterium]